MLLNSCLSKCNIYLLNKLFGVSYYYIIVVLKYIGLCNNISHLKKQQPAKTQNGAYVRLNSVGNKTSSVDSLLSIKLLRRIQQQM